MSSESIRQQLEKRLKRIREYFFQALELDGPLSDYMERCPHRDPALALMSRHAPTPAGSTGASQAAATRQNPPRGSETAGQATKDDSSALPFCSECASMKGRDFIDELDAAADTLVSETLNELEYCANIIIKQPKVRAAALARPILHQWPWTDAVCPRLHQMLLLKAGEPGRPTEEVLRTSWPWELAPRDVALWLKDRVELPEYYPQLFSLSTDFPRDLKKFDAKPWHVPIKGRQAPRAGLALLYLAEQDIQINLRRPAMAIDAGSSHHAMLTGWKDLPKDTRKAHQFETENHIAKLLIPGNAVQLTLNLPGLHEEIVKVLKDWRGWEGVRHWAALLRLLSVEGGRAGWVRWTMDQHLDAMAYSARSRRSPATLGKIAQMIELLTQIELCVYDKSGRERERRPLILVGSRFDRLEGSKWRLDGMELQINPLLYRGVRDMKTGELGSNWHPAPVELAQVDHVRHPYTLALGLILPIRWRWSWVEGQEKGRLKDHITLSGRNLLQVAGIRYDKRRPGETWSSLERNLEELKRIGGIGCWEWLGKPHTLDGMCRLYPADWMLDRTIQGLIPEEGLPSLPVLTGHDLRSWRKSRGMTQLEAAELLGVGIATVKRAEKRRGEALTSKVLEAFRRER